MSLEKKSFNKLLFLLILLTFLTSYLTQIILDFKNLSIQYPSKNLSIIQANKIINFQYKQF
jgi:hypothetical protein